MSTHPYFVGWTFEEQLLDLNNFNRIVTNHNDLRIADDAEPVVSLDVQPARAVAVRTALHEAIAGSHGLGIWAAPFGVDMEKVLLLR